MAARESSTCETDPQSGPTSKDLIEQKRLQLHKATTELQALLFDKKLKEWRDQQLSDQAQERERDS